MSGRALWSLGGCLALLACRPVDPAAAHEPPPKRADPAKETQTVTHSTATRSWADARAVIEAHAAATGGAPLKAVTRTYDAVPWLQRVAYEGGAQALVLVHAGAVVPSGGLDALARYLGASGCLANQASVTVSDLLALVEALDAWPTHPQGTAYLSAGDYFVSGGAKPHLDPSLKRAQVPATSGPPRSVLRLRIAYSQIVRKGPGPGPGVRIGGRSTPATRRFIQWTLTIGPDCQPAWSHTSVTDP